MAEFMTSVAKGLASSITVLVVGSRFSDLVRLAKFDMISLAFSRGSM